MISAIDGDRVMCVNGSKKVEVTWICEFSFRSVLPDNF
jgi:hypothetical protein